MGVVTEVVAASAMGGCSHGGHVTNLPPASETSKLYVTESRT